MRNSTGAVLVQNRLLIVIVWGFISFFKDIYLESCAYTCLWGGVHTHVCVQTWVSRSICFIGLPGP